MSIDGSLLEEQMHSCTLSTDIPYASWTRHLEPSPNGKGQLHMRGSCHHFIHVMACDEFVIGLLASTTAETPSPELLASGPSLTLRTAACAARDHQP